MTENEMIESFLWWHRHDGGFPYAREVCMSDIESFEIHLKLSGIDIESEIEKWIEVVKRTCLGVLNMGKGEKLAPRG
ncbi:MAG: hypothetical protein M0Z41_08900 [Peptococcaceae bacterium]|jgi:hypothetical protein|nr:hypothetical protein [Peptococcaceae bacterium]